MLLRNSSEMLAGEPGALMIVGVLMVAGIEGDQLDGGQWSGWLDGWSDGI